MKIKVDKKELKMIQEGIKLYEEANWETEGQVWQKKINSLIERLGLIK